MPQDLVAAFRDSNNATGCVWKQRSYLRPWELEAALKLDSSPKCIPLPQSFISPFRVFNKITCEGIRYELIESRAVQGNKLQTTMQPSST
jgi:hypothetical protein